MKFYNNHIISYGITIFIFFLSGCQTDEKVNERYSLKGTVTLDNQPLLNGLITFSPLITSVNSESVTEIVSGSFEVPKEYGLLPGQYRVKIENLPPEIMRLKYKKQPHLNEKSVKIPEHYNSQSKLSVEVIDRVKLNEFQFDLKTK